MKDQPVGDPTRDGAVDELDKGSRSQSREVEVLDSHVEYPGRVVHLEIERIRLPNGEECSLEIVRHQGAAAVLPVDANGRVLLVRQYRHATGGWLLEVPAGKLDAGESPEVCALRELEEETGFKAGRLEPMGWIWTTPGFCDERIWLFRATQLEVGEQALERDEVLSLETLPLTEAVEMALQGGIPDSKTICALLRAVALDTTSADTSDPALGSPEDRNSPEYRSSAEDR